MSKNYSIKGAFFLLISCNPYIFRIYHCSAKLQMTQRKIFCYFLQTHYKSTFHKTFFTNEGSWKHQNDAKKPKIQKIKDFRLFWNIVVMIETSIKYILVLLS